MERINDVGRFRVEGTGEDDVMDLENQLDRGGEVEGVVMAVETDEEEALEKESQERLGL